MEPRGGGLGSWKGQTVGLGPAPGRELDLEKRIPEVQRVVTGPREWSSQTLLLVRRLLMEGHALN